jgi:hypothetical protein
MALYEKNPGNNKTEKYLLRVVQILGVLATCAGIYSLYANILRINMIHNPLVWSVFDLVKAINITLLGVGLLVHYKKSVNLYSRSWIFGPILLALLFMIFRDTFYFKPTAFPMVFIPLGVFGILFLVFCWFDCRKKYPEEFGVKN